MVILNRPHQQEIGDSWRGGVLFFLAYRFKRKLFITNVEAVVENSGAVLTRHVYGGLNMKKNGNWCIIFLQEFNTTEDTLSEVFRRSVVQRRKNM